MSENKPFNPVGWFEIYVQDMNRAKKFYEQLFSITLEKLNSPSDEIELWVFPHDINKQGITGALAKMPGCESGANSVMVYFNSENCQNEEKVIEKLGGKVIQPKTSIGEFGFFIMAADTENNAFGIHSMQ